MALHHQILAATYYPITLFRRCSTHLGLASPDQLRVLLYHDIAPCDHGNFAAQLMWLKRSWTFVSPEQFAAMVSGSQPVKGRNLLLTFDDGFTSNRAVAEAVLNPLEIRALFFVVSELVEIESRTVARQFIAERIYPGTIPDNLPQHWANMRWSDIEALLQQGHTVGCHTASHARLSAAASAAELKREVIASGDLLERRLGVQIEHFSYTFGDLGSISESALALARRRYRFIHSGLRGNNAGCTSPFAIRRDSAELQDAQSNYTIFSNPLLGAFLEGAADAHYAHSLATLDAWDRRAC
jgi:peptidoglycan/xylan/chitin deacetylase (PgdA/CDA1 family)